jgi:hypothetical protein
VVVILREIKKNIPIDKKRLPRNKKGICKSCGREYFYKDSKSQHCEDCLTTIVEFECSCGCGGVVRRLKKRFLKYPYARNHDKKGKTYKEIYGTSDPGCGFKKGKDNPNYNIILKDKSNESLKIYYSKNPDIAKRKLDKLKKSKRSYKVIDYSNNEVFNSSYEQKIYNFLKVNHFSFSREVPVSLINKKFKVVDFIIFDKGYETYIEVTGASFALNPNYFIQRIDLLKQSIGLSPLIIIASFGLVDKIEKMVAKLDHTSIFTETIGNFFKIRSLIYLCHTINEGNLILQQLGEL